MHEYNKVYTDTESGYVIIQVRADGINRTVSEEHHDYLDYLAAGNIPTEIAYAAPPAPPEDPVDETALRLDALEAALLDIMRGV